MDMASGQNFARMARPTSNPPAGTLPNLDTLLAEGNLNSARSYFENITDGLNHGNEILAQSQAEFLRDELMYLTDSQRAPVLAELVGLIEAQPENKRGLLFELTGIARPANRAPDALALGVLEALVLEAQSANGDRPQVLERLARRLATESPVTVGDYARRCADLDLCKASDLRATVTAFRRANAEAVRAERAADRAESEREAKRNQRRISAAPVGLPAADNSDEPPFALTDMGNAERLAARFGGTLSYVSELGYLVWSGKRYERSEAGAQRLGKECVRSIYAEAARGADEKEREAISQWAIRSESQARIYAMLALAQSEPEIEARASDFDADPLLLNVQNGTLDLRTGELRPHNPADRLTKIAGTLYDPAATCPTWEAFQWRICNGNQNLIDFKRRAYGYTLTGDISEQCLFMPWGSGANGKSTELETWRNVMGDYGQQAEFSAFLARQSETVRNDLARMAGARFIAAIESGEGRRLAEPVIKALTGGDTITARYLYKEYFEFRPAFKLWLATNHKPKITGTDLAIWRRIRLIPYTVTIPEKERNPHLLAKLREELPGILAWAVRGCLEWQREGLGVPDEVRQATDSYRAEQDTLAAFLDECCVILPSACAKSSELYAKYKAWAEAGGEHPDNQRAFGLRLAERGFTADKGTGGARIWRGLDLVK
jgi:P4 family phage/plasmid primase-like protien